jgi:ubiquinone/menaquinone biosynthesis C-methylase UbiE
MPMPGPLRYDLMLWVAARGREAAFRERQLDLARVTAGESVLDVGCGTGTLAVAAARRATTVHGLDPSSDLLARARKKARRARLEVSFELGSGESLPYSDESFDVVLSSFVLHHLSHDALRDSARELRRVVKPTGRVLIVDTGHGAAHGGGFDLAAMAPRLAAVGLHAFESGPVDFALRGIGPVHYVLARAA